MGSLPPFDSPPILYADDAGDARLFMQWAVERAKLANPLITAVDGRDAQEKLRWLAEGHNRPGLIILDLNMPYLSGMDVLRSIRADPLYSSVVTVFFSTAEAEEAVAAARRNGADGYFLKRNRQDITDLIGQLAPLVGSERSGHWLSAQQSVA